MTTQTSLPPQPPRLVQDAQKPNKVATAPSTATPVESDLRKGTTFGPKGATTRDIRLNRAEQSDGSAGRSSLRQALNKTSEAVASGNCSIEPSQVVPHGAARSPVSSTAKLGDVVNLNSRIMNGPPTDERLPGSICGLILILGALATWAILVFASVYAVSALSSLPVTG